MGNRFAKSEFRGLAQRGCLFLAVVFIMASPLLGSAQTFTVPDDVALRIRLDDTLTSVDSEVGDPFSATIVDQGEYQRARVYGHIVNIDMSGRVDGHTSMVLQFDRLVMPDGRRAPIHAEIIELYHAPSGEKVDLKALSNRVGEAERALSTPSLAQARVRCLAASSEAEKARVSVPSSGVRVVWARPLSMGIKRSR